MTTYTYTPNQSGNIFDHVDAIPLGFDSLGVYLRSDNSCGVVLKSVDGSLWFTTRQGSTRVDGREFKKSQKAPRGKAVAVYLDSDTIGAARKIGDGNLSAGIRKAVAAFVQLPDFLKGL